MQVIMAADPVKHSLTVPLMIIARGVGVGSRSGYDVSRRASTIMSRQGLERGLAFAGATRQPVKAFQARDIALNAVAEVAELFVPAAFDHVLDLQPALFLEGDVLDPSPVKRSLTT